LFNGIDSFTVFFLDILRIKMERRQRRRLKELKEQEEDDNEDFVIPLAEITDTIEGDKTASWDPKLTFQV